MDTWLIVLIALAAIALIAVVVVGGKKKEKRKGSKQEVRDRRLKAEQERIAGHRACAEVSEELAAERADRDRLEAELHERRARENDPTATDNGCGFAGAQKGNDKVKTIEQSAEARERRTHPRRGWMVASTTGR